MKTDSERLDWVLSFNPQIDYSIGRNDFYCKWYKDNGYLVSYGESKRDAIDNAIDNNYSLEY